MVLSYSSGAVKYSLGKLAALVKARGMQVLYQLVGMGSVLARNGPVFFLSGVFCRVGYKSISPMRRAFVKSILVNYSKINP